MKTEIYNIRVRHGGNMLHEIPKEKVTMKEIVLLRAIHGDDSVPDSLITPAGERDVNEKTELFHLAREYGSASDPAHGKKLVEKVFSQPLIGFEAWLAEAIELEDMERAEQDEKRRLSQIEARKEAFREEVRAAAMGQPA